MVLKCKDGGPLLSALLKRGSGLDGGFASGECEGKIEDGSRTRADLPETS